MAKHRTMPNGALSWTVPGECQRPPRSGGVQIKQDPSSVQPPRSLPPRQISGMEPMGVLPGLPRRRALWRSSAGTVPRAREQLGLCCVGMGVTVDAHEKVYLEVDKSHWMRYKEMKAYKEWTVQQHAYHTAKHQTIQRAWTTRTTRDESGQDDTYTGHII